MSFGVPYSTHCTHEGRACPRHPARPQQPRPVLAQGRPNPSSPHKSPMSFGLSLSAKVSGLVTSEGGQFRASRHAEWEWDRGPGGRKVATPPPSRSQGIGSL